MTTTKSLQWLVMLGLALHASALSKCILFVNEMKLETDLVGRVGEWTNKLEGWAECGVVCSVDNEGKVTNNYIDIHLKKKANKSRETAAITSVKRKTISMQMPTAIRNLKCVLCTSLPYPSWWCLFARPPDLCVCVCVCD